MAKCNIRSTLCLSGELWCITFYIFEPISFWWIHALSHIWWTITLRTLRQMIRYDGRVLPMVWVASSVVAPRMLLPFLTQCWMLSYEKTHGNFPMYVDYIQQIIETRTSIKCSFNKCATYQLFRAWGRMPNPANINLEIFGSNTLQKCFLSFSNFVLAFPSRNYAVKFYCFFAHVFNWHLLRSFVC